MFVTKLRQKLNIATDTTSMVKFKTKINKLLGLIKSKGLLIVHSAVSTALTDRPSPLNGTIRPASTKVDDLV